MIESRQKRLFFLLAFLGGLFICVLYFAKNDIVFLQHKFFHTKYLALHNPIEGETLSQKDIKIAFFDIGQGDASFIEWPDKTQMLVDCAVDARILEALGRVMSPLDKTIDYLLITHPDQDHYGGCVDVLKRFEVRHIVYTGYEKNTSDYFDVFQNSIHQEGAVYHQIEKEQTWSFGSSSIHFLYPDMPLKNHPIMRNTKKDASNNTSIVFILQYGTQKVLFTGDAEFEVENYLLQTYSEEVLDIDVLKVGHHGSSGSTSENFLNRTTPLIATISAGRKNRYGHPSLRTLRRLEREGTSIWRSDQKGDIILRVHKDNVYVESQ